MKFFKYLICLGFITIFFNGNIYATETVSAVDVDIAEVQNEQKEQKDKLKKEVSNLVEKLRTNILEIDEKIEILRKTDEYLTYPIIRLNIDTPMFGIKSIINQKLKVTTDVSAADVAKGYSIRDIVQNRVVKVPDVTIANIVVSTKEFKIDEELSIAEYNTLILKLMNYVDKVESVSDFLDIKTNNMFKEYVSKEKQDKLNDLNNRLEKISNDLLKCNEKLIKIYFTQKDNYFDIEDKYIELSKKQKVLDKQVSNVLIESSKLNDLQKDIISLESEVIDYLAKVDNVKIENINIDEVYLNVYSSLVAKLDVIEKYIEGSTIEKTIKEENDKDNESNEDELLNKENLEEKTEVIKNYEVFSGKSVNNMKNIITNLEEKMVKLNITYKSNEDENVIFEKENSSNEEKKETKLAYEKLTKEEVENEFDNLIKKYNEFLTYEYTYYLDNVNELLELTNHKVKKIASVSDESIISQEKYIYIELPVNLENYLDVYSTNSVIETKYLISNFKKELIKLSENYTTILEMYEELESEEKLSNA